MKQFVSRGGAVWLARMAHNHQVAGSNPAPATKIKYLLADRYFILICDAELEPTPLFSTKFAGIASLPRLFEKKILLVLSFLRCTSPNPDLND